MMITVLSPPPPRVISAFSAIASSRQELKGGALSGPNNKKSTTGSTANSPYVGGIMSLMEDIVIPEDVRVNAFALPMIRQWLYSKHVAVLNARAEVDSLKATAGLPDQKADSASTAPVTPVRTRRRSSERGDQKDDTPSGTSAATAALNALNDTWRQIKALAHIDDSFRDSLMTYCLEVLSQGAEHVRLRAKKKQTRKKPSATAAAPASAVSGASSGTVSSTPAFEDEQRQERGNIVHPEELQALYG